MEYLVTAVTSLVVSLATTSVIIGFVLHRGARMEGKDRDFREQLHERYLSLSIEYLLNDPDRQARQARADEMQARIAAALQGVDHNIRQHTELKAGQ